MGFSEMMHAFIAARFYVRLKEGFGERGEAAFLHATRHYAEQRGRRMAQRAIRDGQPLTYDTYCRYSEWVNTEEARACGAANRSEAVSVDPDHEMHIFVCPWHHQFKKMGLPEAGLLYCRDLDASICRGFNPELSYRTTQTLHDHDYCIQIVKDCGLDPSNMPKKDPKNLMPFEYHCAHSYWSYAKTCTAIFGEEGNELACAVLSDLSKEFGKEYADAILKYADTDFTHI
ncbi:MAG: L-2-amino-thiazoline-4-carboxylic acid hydrolase [Firmicutes bacterium]|nr:L-2-amino-thiazoline-4-carboxylic acid hydrolase [Bacillota bacterium]